MEAVILAGGMGTRLANVVNEVPKPMAPVSGRPFLEILLDYLEANGVRKVIFATAYKAEIIKNHFNTIYKNIDISYAEAIEPLGSGGQAKDGLKLATSEDVIVINGDTFFDVDLKKMMEFHKNNKSDFTIAIRKLKDITRSGTITFDSDNKILSFKEKKEIKEGYINGGIYICKKSIFEIIKEEKFSLEYDFLEKYVNNYNLMVFESNGYFIDIGTPEDYYKANNHFSKKKPALFLDRDGTLNEYGKYIYKIEDFKYNLNIKEILKKFSYYEWKIFIITNQAGIARGYYNVEDMQKLHDHIDMELKQEEIQITEWVHCPHHPEFGLEEDRNCNCRKPKAGMILNMMEKYPIKKTKSIMVGDKELDIECGKNAGIKSMYINDFFKEYENILKW